MSDYRMAFKNGPIEPRTKCWKGSSFLVAAGTGEVMELRREIPEIDGYSTWIDMDGDPDDPKLPAIYAKGQGIGVHNVS